ERGMKELDELMKLSPDRIQAACKDPTGTAHASAAGWLAGLIRQGSFRRALAAEVDAEAAVRAENVYELGATAKGVGWLLEQMPILRGRIPGQIRDRQQRLTAPLNLTPERIAQVASAQISYSKLNDVLATAQADGAGGWLGFSRRTGWLIIISFMVCVVGVANAMLMSVTERFREIATMKCLGALDSFIMIIFVMESSLQGLAGGIIGVVVGALLGMMRSAWSFGALVLPNLPGLTLLASNAGNIDPLEFTAAWIAP
ncbi:hypothetical protein LCGC14_2700850, partial [marine sediment metagenome]